MKAAKMQRQQLAKILPKVSLAYVAMAKENENGQHQHGQALAAS
jgi:hypothetical protein